MNQLVISNFAQKSQFLLPGCFPTSSVDFHFYLPTVAGVQYYFKITSIDPNSAYMMPGNDTLAIGDSIAVNAGNDTRSVFYFASAASMPFIADLYAAGTPTTAGQFYPCNITNQMWISNQMICQEGLSAQVSGGCSVQTNPTQITDQTISSIEFISPTSSNQYQLELNKVNAPSQVKLFSLTGELLLSKNIPVGSSSMDCHSLPSGMYLVVLSNKYGTRKEKLVITQ